MKVSVIVPVYNVEKYLAKCLDSLVNQTLKSIEIIIVNDGSPDNSEKIINEYLKKYKNIKYIKQENGGQGKARNAGLEAASGEYIGYVDSDDYVDLTMYEKLYNKAKEDCSDIVICGNYTISNDNVCTEIDKHTSKSDAFFGKMAVWNKLYKKELILTNNIKFRSKVWYEDLDFTVKVLSFAKKISYVDEPLYNYINRPGSTMNNANLKRNLEILDCFDEVLRSVGQNDIVEFLAVDHIYISALVRIIRADGNLKLKKQIINKLIAYMKDKFPNFKHNKYLYTLSNNRKIVYNLLNLHMYALIRILFKIIRR